MKPARKINTRIFLFVLAAVLFYACDDEPKIEREQLVKIYVETTVAQSKFAEFPDSLKKAKEEIFSQYNVTPSEYETTIKGIEAKVDYWNEFFAEAKVYLDSLKNASNQKPSL